MAYCTQADIVDGVGIETLIRLTDDEGAGIVDHARVTKAIEDADAEIDGYAGGRYDLPFSPVPVIVRKCSVDIAIYNLYSRRQGAPADRKERYDNAVKLLKEIAAGNVTLGVSSSTATEATGTDEIKAHAHHSTFNWHTLEDF